MLKLLPCLSTIVSEIGIKNTNHQTETLKKDHLTASALLESRNHSGLRVMRALIKNNIPPPKYPNAKPYEDILERLDASETNIIILS